MSQERERVRSICEAIETLSSVFLRPSHRADAWKPNKLSSAWDSVATEMRRIFKEERLYPLCTCAHFLSRGKPLTLSCKQQNHHQSIPQNKILLKSIAASWMLLYVQAEFSSRGGDQFRGVMIWETLRANLSVVHQRCRLDHDREYHFDPKGRRTATVPERK